MTRGRAGCRLGGLVSNTGHPVRRAVFLIFLTVPAAFTASAARAAEPVVPHAPPLRLAFVGLDGGLMVPFGDWADHASAGTRGYPADTPQFSTGGAGTFSVGFAPSRSRWFTVGLEGSFGQIGTSAWEEFARSRGNPLSASARMWSVAAAGTVAMPGRTSRYGLELHGALGVLAASGEETPDGGADRSYAFLRSTLFGRIGARFVARLVEGMDTYAGLDLLAAPGGVRHRASSAAPGGSVRSEAASTISALEPTLGVRLWFDPL